MTKLLLKLKRSLTTRLLVVFLATSALLVASLFIVIAHGFATQWRVKARPHLEQYLDFVSAEIGSPPSEQKAKELAERLPVNIYIVGQTSFYSTNGQELDIENIRFAHPARRKFNRKSIADANIEFSGDEDRTLLRTTVGDYKVYYELPHLRDAKHQRLIIIPILLCLLTVMGICFLIIKRMLRPVRDIRDGVRLMGQGDLGHRVPVRHDNDLGELAGSINTMASDIEQMLDAKRQLLLGASHELRSPLTRAKVATQLLEESKARDLIEEDLIEMENLIANILESERMKTGHAALQRESFSLPQLIQSVVEETHSANVTINAEENIPPIIADKTRLRILFRNLIGNAVNHNEHTQAPVTVEIESSTHTLLIRVIDSGAGIAPEHLDKVTEPFYRTDASRTRATGGFGLGLHLAKLISEAHGGSLSIESRTADDLNPTNLTGTTVSVVLPKTSMD